MLANIDSNIWGLLAVPVGLTLGFGPVIFAWLWTSYGRAEKSDSRTNLEAEE